MGKRLLRGRHSPGKVRGKEGFTLIEVMISLVITMTAFLAILAMVNTSFRSYGRGKRLTVATNLASQKLGDFKSMEVAAITGGSDTVTEGGTPYTRTWTVSDVDYDGDSVPDMTGDIVKVGVTVSWTQGGKDHQVRMATLTTGKPQ